MDMIDTDVTPDAAVTALEPQKSAESGPTETPGPLTERQARFVTHYLRNGGNASAAARAAGYSHGASGRRLIQQGTIQRAVEQVRPLPEVAKERAEGATHALARVSGERIVGELAGIAFAEIDAEPSHSEKIRALDILAKITGLHNENPIVVNIMQYVRALPPAERRELLMDRGRLIEVLEVQGYTVEASA